MHERIASATLRVTCGNSSGSGFVFWNAKTVITNCHVVEPFSSQGQAISVTTENGTSLAATIAAKSAVDQLDYAVLQLSSPLPAANVPLKPSKASEVSRGQEVIFAGFPHGITDLLVHEAIVSGPSGTKGFYVDGSVNGGNSGGPIVDKASGEVVGIVTQRRFLGGQQLQQLQGEMQQLVQYCNQLSSQGSITLVGINFGELVGAIGRGFVLTGELFSANANAGIGIGFNIEHVENECARLGIQ